MPEKKYVKEFENRLVARIDELKWLYYEIYNSDADAFNYLIDSLYMYYQSRNKDLKALDRKREKNPDWYSGNEILGMMMYTDAFAKTLTGVYEKLDYIKECGVNYLHLMPLLDSPKGRDDGGYAIADFRKVKPELGTMDDLEKLTSKCHKEGISCCLDFVMNHTSEDHEWAKKAREGDLEARKRYFFYDNWDIPNKFEETVPQVFPTTAPGNFTWLDDCKQIVMTSFYPYQWDLNYANCVVFNDMVGNMLFLANKGIDIIRLDAVPYIWKELGTSCRNLKQVHTLVRMMRLVAEVVCPGVLLLGEVVMEPAKVVPYFGSVEKPECHMLYNVTTMASTWNSVATKDVRLLKRQLDQVFALPKDYVFLNYLRCHDDIGWGLDYDWLKNFGINEVPHKKYLNDYFTGKWPGSSARGELYNDDPTLGDARLCGTCASLSGLEAGEYENDKDKIKKSIDCILMLHAYLLSQSGIPMLYSGDEVGQLNDYSYKEDPNKCADSRYIHRGSFKWDSLKKKSSKTIFDTLRTLEKIRESHEIFKGCVSCRTIDTQNNAVLGFVRETDSLRMTVLFNFSPDESYISDSCQQYGKNAKNMISEKKAVKTKSMKPYEYKWIIGEI